MIYYQDISCFGEKSDSAKVRVLGTPMYGESGEVVDDRFVDW